MEKKTIGNFIAVLRKAKGLTQQDLADTLGVSNKTVSKWECDETYPDISLLPAIAEVLEVSCDELLRGERILSDGNKTEKSDKKGVKQLTLMLNTHVSKFKMLSMISIMSAVVAAIVNFIVSYAVKRPDIGFGVMAVLFAVCVAIEIFALNGLSGKFADKSAFENSGIDVDAEVNKVKFQYSFKVFYSLLAMLFLLLPVYVATELVRQTNDYLPVTAVINFDEYLNFLPYAAVPVYMLYVPLKRIYEAYIYAIKPAVDVTSVFIIVQAAIVLVVYVIAMSYLFFPAGDYALNIIPYLIIAVLALAVATIVLAVRQKDKQKRRQIVVHSVKSAIFILAPLLQTLMLFLLNEGWSTVFNYVLLVATVFIFNAADKKQPAINQAVQQE